MSVARSPKSPAYSTRSAGGVHGWPDAVPVHSPVGRSQLQGPLVVYAREPKEASSSSAAEDLLQRIEDVEEDNRRLRDAIAEVGNGVCGDGKVFELDTLHRIVEELEATSRHSALGSDAPVKQPTFAIGDSVAVDRCRRGVVIWDGRPAQDYISVRWADNGVSSDLIAVRRVVAVAPSHATSQQPALREGGASHSSSLRRPMELPSPALLTQQPAESSSGSWAMRKAGDVVPTAILTQQPAASFVSSGSSTRLPEAPAERRQQAVAAGLAGVDRIRHSLAVMQEPIGASPEAEVRPTILHERRAASPTPEQKRSVLAPLVQSVAPPPHTAPQLVVQQPVVQQPFPSPRGSTSRLSLVASSASMSAAAPLPQEYQPQAVSSRSGSPLPTQRLAVVGSPTLAARRGLGSISFDPGVRLPSPRPDVRNMFSWKQPVAVPIRSRSGDPASFVAPAPPSELLASPSGFFSSFTSPAAMKPPGSSFMVWPGSGILERGGGGSPAEEFEEDTIFLPAPPPPMVPPPPQQQQQQQAQMFVSSAPSSGVFEYPPQLQAQPQQFGSFLRLAPNANAQGAAMWQVPTSSSMPTLPGSIPVTVGSQPHTLLPSGSSYLSAFQQAVFSAAMVGGSNSPFSTGGSNDYSPSMMTSSMASSSERTMSPRRAA
eukprot:TRINITY_DN2832_c3_g1_i1.p1 TRINITY_DN2832_c3_g1~~TRINITY_DN2832_c3_g1_i1.p1  ORF type:complete len:657 (+),score=117.49 TRINITY_DN2832_c3_g1_i1:235-2205(+)